MRKTFSQSYRLLAIILLFFTVPGFADSSLLNISQYKGKVVYVDFWASWCLPCRKSFPWMQAMQAKYMDKGLQIVAVNLDEVSGDANSFLSDFDMNFEIVYDPKGSLAEHFEVKGMPTTLLFDANGDLHSRHIGFKAGKKSEYESAFVKLLP